MLTIREIRDFRALDEFSSGWADLLAATPGANYFQSLDWLRVYWGHFGGPRQLRVLIAERQGELAGILPLVVRTDRTPLGPLRSLTYPLDDWGTFYGPIGPNPAAILGAGLAHVRRSPRDWDVLDLHWVPPRESDPADTCSQLSAAGYASSTRLCSRVALVDLAGDWPAYLASRKPKWRENLRRAQRKAESIGQLEYTHYRSTRSAAGDSDPRWYLYNACERVAARSWQGSVTRGTTLSHSAVRPFLRDAHRVAANAGAVDLHLLTVDRRPAAFLYNYVYRGYVYGLRSGFDPIFERLEVAKVLQARALETCFSLGDVTYDLGPDQIAYKQHWATRIVGSYSYCHYPFTDLRAQALAWNRRVRGWLRMASSAKSREGAAR